jgi:hypothetical protein
MNSQLIHIPDDVIAAARKVSTFVAEKMHGFHDIKIYGIGVRTFLSVGEMFRECSPSERISELKLPPETEG